MTKMQKAVKYYVAGVVLVITLLSFPFTHPASAQTTSGSFNPQTKFQVGSSFTIASIYGIATIHSHNQSNPSHQPHQRIQAGQKDSETSDASITVNAQVANETRNGGVQWTIKTGTLTIKGSPLTVTGGRGEIDSLDRLVIIGTATNSNAQTFRWQLTGLATTYNGMVIAEITGNASNEPTRSSQRVTVLENVDLTYITTIS
jgi:hypothetical protein